MGKSASYIYIYICLAEGLVIITTGRLLSTAIVRPR